MKVRSGGWRPDAGHGGRHRPTATRAMCFPRSSPMAANSSTCRGRRTRCGSGRWIRARPTRLFRCRIAGPLRGRPSAVRAPGDAARSTLRRQQGDARGRSDGDRRTAGCRLDPRGRQRSRARKPAFSCIGPAQEAPQTQLTWVDRSGREIGKVGPVGRYRNPDVIGTTERASRWKRRIPKIARRICGFWSCHAARPRGSPSIAATTSTPSGRPTTAASRSAPIGKGAFTTCTRRWRAAALGKQLLLASTGDNLTGPYDWSPDGKFLLFRDLSPETSVVNTGILPLSGDRAIRHLFPPAIFLQTTSPDLTEWPVGGIQLERNRAHGSLHCEVPQPKWQPANLEWRCRLCALAR